jgi:hypothetical protein
MTMRFLLASSLLMAGGLFLTRSVVPGAPAQSPTPTEGTQVIEVTAKKYEFDPISGISDPREARVKSRAQNHRNGSCTWFQDKAILRRGPYVPQSRSSVLVSPRVPGDREAPNRDS